MLENVLGNSILLSSGTSCLITSYSTGRLLLRLSLSCRLSGWVLLQLRTSLLVLRILILLHLGASLLDFCNKHFGKLYDLLTRGNMLLAVLRRVIRLVPKSLQACLVLRFLILTQGRQTSYLVGLIHRRRSLLSCTGCTLLLALALLALLSHLRIHDGYDRQVVFGVEVGMDAMDRVRKTILEHDLYKIPRKFNVLLSSVRK